MYYWMALPVASLKQFSVSFQQHQEPRDSAATGPIFIAVAATGIERCMLNNDQVLSSLIGQWISPYFSVAYF